LLLLLEAVLLGLPNPLPAAAAANSLLPLLLLLPALGHAWHWVLWLLLLWAMMLLLGGCDRTESDSGGFSRELCVFRQGWYDWQHTVDLMGSILWQCGRVQLCNTSVSTKASVLILTSIDSFTHLNAETLSLPRGFYRLGQTLQ
jgi:hypothetical protein